MPAKHRTTIDLRFTLPELEILDRCLGSGWADGDFKEFCTKDEARALKHAWATIGDGIRMLRASKEVSDVS